MQIDESVYNRMPPHLQALFTKDANPGKAEVIEAFPQNNSSTSSKAAAPYRPNGKNAVYGKGMGGGFHPGFNDSGSAARFFYSAKANKTDRAGSKHPTIKPVSLMKWLCKLVTPPGGVILDPFAGSGTTGQAALENGFRCVLCEREVEYVQDIIRRIGSLPKKSDPAA